MKLKDAFYVAGMCLLSFGGGVVALALVKLMGLG